ATGVSSSTGSVTSGVSSGVSFTFSVSSATVPFLSDRQNSGDLTPCNPQARRVLELPRRRLEAQVEELLPGVGEAAVELVVRQVPQVLSQQRDHHSHGARTSS